MLQGKHTKRFFIRVGDLHFISIESYCFFGGSQEKTGTDFPLVQGEAMDTSRHVGRQTFGCGSRIVEEHVGGPVRFCFSFGNYMVCWGSSSGSVLPTMTPNDQNNLDRKPLYFLILVVLPGKLNSSYVSFRGCTCFRCLLRLGLILSWLEQARNTRTHFSSCEISILRSWCPFHFGWLDSDPPFLLKFFFGTTSTSEGISVFFSSHLRHF